MRGTVKVTNYLRNAMVVQLRGDELMQLIEKAVESQLKGFKYNGNDEVVLKGYQGLADYLKVSTSTIYNYIKTGRLDKAIIQDEVGGLINFRKRVIDEIFEL